MNPFDRLFLSPNLNSEIIRTSLNWGVVVSDSATGANGHGLRVFIGLSSIASSELLSKFGLSNEAPVLEKSDGTVVADKDEIITYLKQNGMTDTRGL